MNRHVTRLLIMEATFGEAERSFSPHFHHIFTMFTLHHVYSAHTASLFSTELSVVICMVKHDDYMTPFSAWEDVSAYIPRHLTLWEAFYGDGTAGAHLALALDRIDWS